MANHVELLKEFDSLPPIEIPKLTPKQHAEKIAVTAIQEIREKEKIVKEHLDENALLRRTIFNLEKQIDSLQRDAFGQRMYIARIKSRIHVLLNRLRAYEPVMADSLETLLLGPKFPSKEVLPTGINKKLDDPPVDNSY
jgi:hypothetical protein